MKFGYFCLIISSSFFVLNVLADEERMTFNDMIAALESFGESCEEKPTRDNILDIIMHTKDVERESKCFRRCLMELFELVIRRFSLDKEFSYKKSLHQMAFHYIQFKMFQYLPQHDPDSNKMREETTLEFGGLMYPQRKEEFKMILDTCNARNAHVEDKCDAAHEHFLCMTHELESNGFEIPEIAEE